MIPLIYSPNYNITAFGLERLHPFDGRKYRRIRDWLIRQGLRHRRDFVCPSRTSREELQLVHTSAYLEKLRKRSELARIIEVPIVSRLPHWLIDWRILKPMRWATGGTILACRVARERGLAINLAGGYHHASSDRGAGFCVYADVPVALAKSHALAPFRSVLIVDTDAHQGDGNANSTRSWGWVHILDLFEEAIFPWPKATEEVPVPLRSGCTGGEYLAILQESLPRALDRFHPELVVYNAGSDVLVTDPLASLTLTSQDLCERDLYVVTEVRDRRIPLAMVLSGGYGPHSWEAHARSIEGLVTRFDSQT